MDPAERAGAEGRGAGAAWREHERHDASRPSLEAWRRGAGGIYLPVLAAQRRRCTRASGLVCPFCVGASASERLTLTIRATEADRLDEKIFTMMARNCGKKDDYFLKLVDKKKHADWFLDAKECVKHNLANHIRVPKISVNVDVTIDFE